MTVGDVPAVAVLEIQSLSSWSQEQIAVELEQERGTALVSTSFSGEIQGWCCGSQVDSEAELLKITVCPGWRRQGVGVALLQALCEQLAADDVEQIYLEVRSSNIPACQLYLKLGWQEVGNRKKYYRNPVDDAHVFVRTLTKDTH